MTKNIQTAMGVSSENKPKNKAGTLQMSTQTLMLFDTWQDFHVVLKGCKLSYFKSSRDDDDHRHVAPEGVINMDNFLISITPGADENASCFTIEIQGVADRTF